MGARSEASSFCGYTWRVHRRRVWVHRRRVWVHLAGQFLLDLTHPPISPITHSASLSRAHSLSHALLFGEGRYPQNLHPKPKTLNPKP